MTLAPAPPRRFLNSRNTAGTYRAITGLEGIEFLLSAWPLLGRGDGLDRWLDDLFPEILVVGAQEDNNSGALRVKRAWAVQNCLVHNFDDLFIGNRGTVLKGIIGSPCLDGGKKRVGHGGL